MISLRFLALGQRLQNNPLVNPLGRRLGLRQQVAQFLNAPDVVAQASFHRWRDAQCRMNAAEVVVHEIQRDRVTVIVNFLAEGVVGQPDFHRWTSSPTATPSIKYSNALIVAIISHP